MSRFLSRKGASKPAAFSQIECSDEEDPSPFQDRAGPSMSMSAPQVVPFPSLDEEQPVDPYWQQCHLLTGDSTSNSLAQKHQRLMRICNERLEEVFDTRISRLNVADCMRALRMKEIGQALVEGNQHSLLICRRILQHTFFVVWIEVRVLSFLSITPCGLQEMFDRLTRKGGGCTFDCFSHAGNLKNGDKDTQKYGFE